MMSWLPLGKFQPSARVSTAMPSGWARLSRRAGLPSQLTNQRSPWDAAMPPCSAGSNRSPCGSLPSARSTQGVAVEPTAHGTRATSGQLAASVASADEKIGRTSSPLSPPAVLLKNAPAVSPANPFTDLSPGAMTPATLMPEPKTYWSAVPRGQMPPPTVDEPVAQIWPDETPGTAPGSG